MNAEKKISEMKEDALVLVALRNAFYRKKYHLFLGIYFLSILVIIVLFFMLLFLLQHPPKPFYFAADQAGRLIEEVPLQNPNMSTQEVTAWAIEAVQTAYSYDYVNYRAQLQNAQKYFADYGWRNYMKGLTASNNLVGLKDRQMIFIAKVVAPPKLIAEGLLGGAYAWKFEMPVLVTYLMPPYDDKSQFANPLLVTVIIQRKNALESYRGIAIQQMISTLVSS